MDCYQVDMEIDKTAMASLPIYARNLTRLPNGVFVWSGIYKIGKEKKDTNWLKASWQSALFQSISGIKRRRLDRPQHTIFTDIKAEYPPELLNFDGNQIEEDEEKDYRSLIPPKSLHLSPDHYECTAFDYIPTPSPSPHVHVIKSELWIGPDLEVGGVYLAAEKVGGARRSTVWFKARLDAIEEEMERSGGRGRGPGRYHVTDLRSGKSVRVSGRRLAYVAPPDGVLRVGCRVLAAYRVHLETGEMEKRKKFQTGIVGELPGVENEFRYLVIFDNGFWLYVLPQDIRCIYHTREHVWKELREPVASQVREYLTDVDKEKASFSQGQKLTVRHGALEHKCTVITTDASLVLVHYGVSPKPEWIYRGSSRLSNCYHSYD